MIITLDEAKQFLRMELDYTNEDTFLNALISASENYIKNATGKIFDNTNELAKLAVKLLVTNWYENRQIETNTSLSKISYSLGCILTQLTYCQGGVSV